MAINIINDKGRRPSSESGFGIIGALTKVASSFTNPFTPSRDYVRPQSGDAYADAAKLGRDMSAIGGDLGRVVNRELIKKGG